MPVYRWTLDLRGRFERPDFTAWGIAAEDVLWDRAQLWVQISDARAIQEPTALSWNGETLAFAAGTGDFGQNRRNILELWSAIRRLSG